MKHLVAISAIALASAMPARADDATGRSLMEEGARLLMEGLLKEMEPALDELQGLADEIQPKLREFWAEMGPALGDLMQEIEDWSAYHPPEVLPNGDIIIRRKTPAELAAPQPGEEIET